VNDSFSFKEFMVIVKKYQPIVKQANLIITESEAKLLQARGGFDPNFGVDVLEKKWDNLTYYNRFNATFEIPTWYGISFHGDFNTNMGSYLNPEDVVPDAGLYGLGVSVSLAKDLIINKRLATLKQAKLYKSQAEAENQLMVNEILYQASISYFNWLKAYQEYQLYVDFLKVASIRFEGIKQRFILGDCSAIDTIEAGIAMNNRKLSVEKAKLNLKNMQYLMSNFVWIENIPVEIKDFVYPIQDIAKDVDEVLQISSLNTDLTMHPKLVSLNMKYRSLQVEKKNNINDLLPSINLKYNMLTNASDFANPFLNNYKAGLSINYPFLVRKERAKLKLTQTKIQGIGYEKLAATWTLENKINMARNKIESYVIQINQAVQLNVGYKQLLKAEERKLEIGESSVFMVVSRENQWIQSRLKQIELEYLMYGSKGELFNIFGAIIN